MKKRLSLFVTALFVVLGTLAFTGQYAYGNEAPPVVCDICDDEYIPIDPFCILDPDRKKRG